MSSFQEARDALTRTLLAVWPDAKPMPRWAGVEAWGAPRPEGAIVHGSTGTYDPKVTVVGIADRKSGPVVYFLDPGDYFALETHKALLEGAGLKLGRGCIMHTRKGPLPTEPLERLFRLVKARDADAAAKTTPKKAAKKAAPERAPAKTPASRGMGAGAASSVEAYLARLPEAQREALERLRRQVKAAAPKATEAIRYGMPTFVHEGSLVHMAAFRDHCSFFPGSGDVTRALKSHLAGFETAKGTIRFTPEKPLPAALVKRIVKLRVAENEARAKERTGRAAKAARPTKGASKKAAKKKAPARR
jgi:uncharacterized protein YdhG (YjbR/CyaY superfamily)